jgi:hypothetical protein
VLVDLVEQVVEDPADAVEALLGRQVDAFEQVLDELTELGSVLRRKPSMSAMTRIGMCWA